MKEFLICIAVASLCRIISAQTDVRLPPTVTRSMRGHVKENDGSSQVWLDCFAKGTPTVRIEWKMNGFQLNTNVSYIRERAGGSITIMVNRETKTAEGYYQCFAINQYGTALSDMIHVPTRFIEPTAGPLPVLQKTVVEGMPLQIQCRGDPDSDNLPKWYTATEVNAQLYAPVKYSERIQISQNGDLHFAYARLEDSPNGSIYTCSDGQSSFASLAKTQLTVTRNRAGNINRTTPTLAFVFPNSSGTLLSETETVALLGEPMTLECFFYGYPQPTLSWRTQRNIRSAGSPTLYNYKTVLYLAEVAKSDEGSYSCTGSNTEGVYTHTFQIRVGAIPKYNNRSDLYNPVRMDINVTEGESATFQCDAFAIPEANIVWLQNGQTIDNHNPPQRFAFSNDNKNLMIIDVCRDCVDREKKTDLMVIQCNASNVHGYAFAQGYLNVLIKTKVTITASSNVSADSQKFIYRCNVTSDPSTPLTVRWYKTEPFDNLVQDKPPYVHVDNEFLSLTVPTNCSSECAKYFGKYRCVADNGYSQDNCTITHPFQHEDITQKVETWAAWQIILVAAGVGFVLVLIGILLYFVWKTRFRDVSSQGIERRAPNPAGVYDDAGYDSIGLPLKETVRSNQGSMVRESGEDDHIGYDSIDKVGLLGKIESTGYTMPHSLDLNGPNIYESLDAAQKEDLVRENPILHSGITCDDMEYLMPLQEVANGAEKDQQQVNG